MARPDIADTICSPLLGVKRVSLKSGFIIWLIQALMFGVVISEIARSVHLGGNPLIIMW